MNPYKPLFLNVFLLLSVTACAIRPEAPPPVGGFELRGKLAVREAGERFSGNFLWRQQGERFDIDIWGPLGQGRVHLVGEDDRMSVLDGDGAVVQTGTQQQVMEAALGWSMPLDVLPYWVLGMPDERIPAEALVLDDGSRIRSFVQAGWEIKLEDYREVAQDAGARWLPRRIDATRDATSLRLVISTWHLGAGI